jgi:hypothetical protein
MLYQQKMATSVDLLVDSSSQNRNLTMELSKKNKVIESLKEELTKLSSSVQVADMKKDEDLTTYLANIIKAKDAEISNKELELK